MNEAPRLPAPYRALVLEETDSTNEEAKRRAEAGEAGPLWILAKRQSAGRGRRGRAWETGAANFAGTLLIRPQVSAALAAQLSFVAAVSVAAALENYVPVGISLKWPNDVLVNRKKISGILLESSSGELQVVDWLAVGIGVNLAAAPEGTPYPAICLKDVLSEDPPPPTAFLEALASAWANHYEAWQSEGFAPIRAAWLARAEGLGAKLTARTQSRTREGLFIDLDEAGALILETDGTREAISSGEVFFG